MRLLVLALAGVAVWFLLRRRGTEERRVRVGWQDGSEIELHGGTPERDRLLGIAEGTLR
jgi:hypothetical protein